MEEDPNSLEGVAGRLRRNESGYSCIDVKLNPGYEARHLELLTEAILANETLEEVKFFGILADHDVNEAAKRLVQSFGTLPKLKSLEISGYCDDLLHVLSQILTQTAENLKKLSIVYVQLVGDHLELQQSIQGLTNLEEFQLVDCQLPRHLQDENSFLDETIESLCRLPCIKVIRLVPIQGVALGSISPEPLRRLCQIPDLKGLQINGFVMTEESCPLLGTICLELLSSRTIRDLEVSGSFSKENCQSIAELVNFTTSMRELRLHLTQKGSQTDKHIVELAQALQQNTSLTSLHICGSNRKCVFEHLDDFGRLLEKNYVLQSVGFHGARDFPSPIVQFYIKLNQLGRGALLQNAHARRKDWIEKLGECEGDLDSLFYFLSMNPSLCDADVDRSVPS